MTASEQTQLIFAGVGGTLVLASLVGWLLTRRCREEPARSVVTNLNARIRAWWVMVALLGAALLAGRAGVVTLFALLSLLALREFLTLTPTRRADYVCLVVTFFIALPAQYAFVFIEWYGMFSIFIPVYAFLLLPILSAWRSDPQDFLRRAAETQWGLMVTVYCVSHVPALLTLEIPGYEGRNVLLVVFLVLVVQGSDVLQYTWGKLCGRRKIAPALSPSKTVEGFLGGVASATALGASLWWVTPFSGWQAGALALAVALMGFLGGLVMSAIKRDRGVKDWGHLIQGHGGVLDRIDSVCFSAPIYFHLIRYYFTP